MYDRTTWIAILFCGGLLAVNLHYSAKNRAEAEKVRQEQAKQQQSSTHYLADATVETRAELTVEPEPPPTDEELVSLGNKEVTFTLSNFGAGIKYAEFTKQHEVGSKDKPVRANRFGSAPIGALANNSQNPINFAYRYQAQESSEGRKAVYIAKLPSGLVVKKTYTLEDDSKPGGAYLVHLTLELENAGNETIPLDSLSLFLGEASPIHQREVTQQTAFFWREDGSIHSEDSGAFRGGMFGGAPQSIINSPAGEIIELAGVTNQFFATAIQPLAPTATSLWAKTSEVRLTKDAKPLPSVRAGLRLPSTNLEPRQNLELDYRIFIGPKHNHVLRAMNGVWGQGWGDVMQYGWFWFVSHPLNWLLNIYHELIDGFSKEWAWGLAIILLTITVRALIWPLHAKSTRTMKKMSKLKPEMDKLREKYADDPNKLNMETMGLYRKYGINPLGGCLPMFLQIPIFFGFYRMLQYAVELRGEGFLWVPDLSQPDTLHTFHLPFSLPLLGTELPINLLPIVMAITSFVQLRMTPMTGDRMQQRIMMMMPFMFFFFCYSFASALALYWTTQNLFSIGQTWLMGKIPEPELKAKQGDHKKSWLQRMAEQQAQMQKAQREGRGANMRDVTPKKKRGPRTGG